MLTPQLSFPMRWQSLQLCFAMCHVQDLWRPMPYFLTLCQLRQTRLSLGNFLFFCFADWAVDVQKIKSKCDHPRAVLQIACRLYEAWMVCFFFFFLTIRLQCICGMHTKRQKPSAMSIGDGIEIIWKSSSLLYSSCNIWQFTSFVQLVRNLLQYPLSSFK